MDEALKTRTISSTCWRSCRVSWHSRLSPLIAPFLLVACHDGNRVVGVQSPPGRLTPSVDSIRFWVGDTARIRAEFRGPDGALLETPITWSSTTAAVRVSADGLVTAIARGVGHVRVTAGLDTLLLAVTSLPVIAGQVHASGAADPAGLKVKWTPFGRASDSTWVGANGEFTLRVSHLDAHGELLIDGAPPRAFHPFLYPFDVDSLSLVSVVLIPTEWTIRRGLYAGETLPFSLDLVMDELMPYLTYFGGIACIPAFCKPGEVAYVLRQGTIPLDRFPLRVAFDPRPQAHQVSQEDSIRMWRVLERMEELFGLDLFQPTTAPSDWWPEDDLLASNRVTGVVRLTLLDHESYAFTEPGAGPDSLLWRQDLGEWAGGGSFSSFILHHRLLERGTIWMWALDRWEGSPFTWQLVLMHEMLHVLGVGHACRFPTTQGPCMRTQEPSPHDVAYIELLREITMLERQHGTFLSIMPATIGERRLLLGLPALPTFGPRTESGTVAVWGGEDWH